MVIEELLESINLHITKKNIHEIWNIIFPEEYLESTVNENLYLEFKDELIEHLNNDETHIIQVYNILMEEELDEIESYVFEDSFNDDIYE